MTQNLTRKQKEQYLKELEALHQEKARRNLATFAQYVMPEYEIVEKIHKPIIELLMRVLNGQVKKAIINMPPRMGKSELISKIFPAFVLGKFPKKNIITATYGEDLSWDLSRGCKKIINSEYFQQLFPNWKFWEKKEGLYWETSEWWFYYATTTQGQITGKWFNIGIIDDPVRGRTDAESESVQRRIRNWYKWDFISRRQNQDAAILLMQTRRHTNDLTWLLLEEEHDSREKLVIPAINEEWDEIIRPWKFDKGYFKDLKQEIWVYDFASLYQQTPYISWEGIFNNDWFQYYDDKELEDKNLKIVTFVDPAISQKQEADNTAMVTVGIDVESNFIYVLDVFADKLNPEEIYENVFRLHREFNPEKIWIESNAYQKSLIFEINKQMRLRNQYFVLDDINHKMEKEARIKSILTPRYSRGSILHPNDNSIQDLENELLAFPKWKRDDRVDALSSAISLLNVRNVNKNAPSIIEKDYSAYL